MSELALLSPVFDLEILPYWSPEQLEQLHTIAIFLNHPIKIHLLSQEAISVRLHRMPRHGIEVMGLINSLAAPFSIRRNVPRLYQLLPRE